MLIQHRIAKLRADLTITGKIPDALFVGRREISQLQESVTDFLNFRYIDFSKEIKTFMDLIIIPVDIPTFLAIGNYFKDDEIST